MKNKDFDEHYISLEISHPTDKEQTDSKTSKDKKSNVTLKNIAKNVCNLKNKVQERNLSSDDQSIGERFETPGKAPNLNYLLLLSSLSTKYGSMLIHIFYFYHFIIFLNALNELSLAKTV